MRLLLLCHAYIISAFSRIQQNAPQRARSRKFSDHGRKRFHPRAFPQNQPACRCCLYKSSTVTRTVGLPRDCQQQPFVDVQGGLFNRSIVRLHRWFMFRLALQTRSVVESHQQRRRGAVTFKRGNIELLHRARLKFFHTDPANVPQRTERREELVFDGDVEQTILVVCFSANVSSPR